MKMPKLSELGEKTAVARILEHLDPSRMHSLGDDCAVVDMGREYLLLTTDMINERTHVPEGARPRDIGWHVAAINLSDIAAMGGAPLGLLVAIGLPSAVEWDWLEEMVQGIQDCCGRYGIPVLGGDLKENDVMTVSGTAVGTVSRRGVLRRKGARPGDILAMTGCVGRAVKWQKDKGSAQGLLRIEPRLREGQVLSDSGVVTSCIDLSDGLSMSLYHLSEAGQVGFEVDIDNLPMFEGLGSDMREEVMYHGGDYELLFTLDPRRAERVFNADLGDVKITRIGTVIDGGIFFTSSGQTRELPRKGYEHFKVRE
ncbi:MAG: thiamine-phosphate kinase [Thermoplasmata archaeon]|nr:thiamine-phosphate kinase [Thermoplasmata archaeon]